MAQTGFSDLEVEDANTAVAGRGDVTAQLARITTDLTALKNLANDLKAKFDVHVHVENTAGSYTQNASTAVPTAVTAVAAVTITAK